jgi:hypothetical protein
MDASIGRLLIACRSHAIVAMSHGHQRDVHGIREAGSFKTVWVGE